MVKQPSTYGHGRNYFAAHSAFTNPAHLQGDHTMRELKLAN